MTMHASISFAQAAPVARADSLAPVKTWLWSLVGLVFAMVVVGGATRLTESGLSITEWKLVTGILPPLSAAAWAAEFDKYKQIPQFAQMFPDMDLARFQSIFFWEWGHRILGRVIGLAIMGPLVFFWATGRLPARLKSPLVGLLALVALQGAVGWWMVKSGLSERVEVSQYRLATHLLLASFTLGWLVWLTMGLSPRPATRAGAGMRATSSVLVALVFAQLGLGALVAGLWAGLIYNTWPLMDGRLAPSTDVLFSQTPLWSNIFENVTTVQFDHRVIAYALLALALVHAFDAVRRSPSTRVTRGAGLLAVLVAGQGALGVLTLLSVVWLPLALMHQAMAMLVLIAAVAHRRRFSPPLLQAAASA